MDKIKYKRNEDKILEYIKAYIDSTYSGHYAQAGNRDTADRWEEAGIAKENFLGNIIKYVDRFGKKDGENPKDIIKVIHYSIFLLNELQKSSEKSEGENE